MDPHRGKTRRTVELVYRPAGDGSDLLPARLVISRLLPPVGTSSASAKSAATGAALQLKGVRRTALLVASADARLGWASVLTPD